MVTARETGKSRTDKKINMYYLLLWYCHHCANINKLISHKVRSFTWTLFVARYLPFLLRRRKSETPLGRSSNCAHVDGPLEYWKHLTHTGILFWMRPPFVPYGPMITNQETVVNVRPCLHSIQSGWQTSLVCSHNHFSGSSVRDTKRSIGLRIGALRRNAKTGIQFGWETL